MAAFWSDGKTVPNRSRNFVLQIKDVWFWALSVTKPSFDIAVGEYQIVNHKMKYPGLVTWNDITIRIVDYNKKAHELMKALGNSGFIGSNSYNGEDGIHKTKPFESIIIEQRGEDISNIVEKWELANPWIKSINFGELNYSSDEFVEIEIIIAYDWAELKGADFKPKSLSGTTSDPSGAEPPLKKTPKAPPKKK